MRRDTLRGVSVEEHRERAPSGGLGFAVVVVSDNRTPATDRNGPLVRARVLEGGHRVEAEKLVPNDVPTIRAELASLLKQPGVDAIVFCGGTGFSPRDLTVDAIRPLLERELEGFGELFRALSFREIGAAAMLSRALGGIVGRRAVFVLPGSTKAVSLALESLILPEISHLVAQVRQGASEAGPRFHRTNP
jgi:molybdenum cofactor biosynthesis protein B